MTIRTIHLRTTDSTNSEVRRLLLAGEAMPVLVRADTQTAGRGRNGRLWQSPAGGAWFSIGWKMIASADVYAPVPIITAAAVHEALAPRVLPDRRVSIKWPNDILIDGRKVCGVLCETAFVGTRGAVIIGIGINATLDVASLGDELRCPATSLHEHARTAVNIDQVIADVSASLARRLQVLDEHGLTREVIQYVDTHLAGRGRSITWSSVVAEPTSVARRTGVVRGLSDTGALLLETADDTLTLDHGELLADTPAELT